MELVAAAMEGLEEVWDNVDSEDYYLSSVATDLREIHHEACRMAGPGLCPRFSGPPLGILEAEKGGTAWLKG